VITGLVLTVAITRATRSRSAQPVYCDLAEYLDRSACITYQYLPTARSNGSGQERLASELEDSASTRTLVLLPSDERYAALVELLERCRFRKCSDSAWPLGDHIQYTATGQQSLLVQERAGGNVRIVFHSGGFVSLQVSGSGIELRLRAIDADLHNVLALARCPCNNAEAK
jgi:hypothetical protein